MTARIRFSRPCLVVVLETASAEVARPKKSVSCECIEELSALLRHPGLRLEAGGTTSDGLHAGSAGSAVDRVIEYAR